MPLEESYGEGWNKPFHPEEHEVALRAWYQAAQTGEPYHVESRLRAANGTCRWVPDARRILQRSRRALDIKRNSIQIAVRWWEQYAIA